MKDLQGKTYIKEVGNTKAKNIMNMFYIELGETSEYEGMRIELTKENMLIVEVLFNRKETVSMLTKLFGKYNEYEQETEEEETMISYDKCLNGCINELIEIVKNDDGMTIDRMYDNAIYPNNEELTKEFTDEHGFDQESFILYLIKRSEILDTVWSDKYEEWVIALI